MRARPLLLAPLALALLALGLAACDDAFDPLIDDGPAFAIDGVLDARQRTQRLRVQDLRSSVFETPDRLPATVTSTDLETGATTTWRDSLATLPDSTRGHLFVAEFDVRAGATYRIEAVREDGARSDVAVTLPSPTAQAGPASSGPSAAVRVDLADLRGRATDPVVRYRVRRTDGTGDTSFTTPISIQTDGEATSFLAFFGPAETRASSILYGTSVESPVFLEARLEATVTSADASPVTNGVGGVGWVATVSVPIPVSPETLAQVGFIDGR